MRYVYLWTTDQLLGRTIVRDFQAYDSVRRKFIRWIEQGQSDNPHAQKWGHLYNNDPESAMCEAMFWGVLCDCGVEVTPNESLDGKAKTPDFKCEKDGQKFYVEVTHIGVSKATEETGLPPFPKAEVEAQWYSPLNKRIHEAVRAKTPQCASSDAPCLVAIGTFHFRASCTCFDKHFVQTLLTGDELITRDLDARTGDSIGETYLSTRLGSAAFLRPGSTGGLEHARTPVSGLLLAGFGCKNPDVYGLLHPRPVRPFSRQLLSSIEFCQLKKGYESGTLGVEWI